MGQKVFEAVTQRLQKEVAYRIKKLLSLSHNSLGFNSPGLAISLLDVDI